MSSSQLTSLRASIFLLDPIARTSLQDLTIQGEMPDTALFNTLFWVSSGCLPCGVETEVVGTRPKVHDCLQWFRILPGETLVIIDVHHTTV